MKIVRFLSLCLLVLVCVTSRADAQIVVVNNGLAPPNPANVQNSATPNRFVIDNAPPPPPGGTATLFRIGPLGNIGAGPIGPFVNTSLVTRRTSGAATFGLLAGHVQALGQSQININSGIVNGNANARNFSLINVNPAPGALSNPRITNNLQAFDDARINLRAGDVGNDVIANQRSFVSISGGNVDDDVEAYHNSRIRITGGVLGGGDDGEDVRAYGASRINMFGGTVSNDLEAFGHSRVRVFGGTIEDDAVARNRSRMLIAGGSVADDVEAHDRSIIAIIGGSIGEDIESFNHARIFIAGGELGETIDASDYSLIKIFGADFFLNGNPIGFGPITDLSGDLSGTLADGMPFDLSFERDSGAAIKLCPIPEPASVITWCVMGAVFFVGRKRFSR